MAQEGRGAAAQQGGGTAQQGRRTAHPGGTSQSQTKSYPHFWETMNNTQINALKENALQPIVVFKNLSKRTVQRLAGWQNLFTYHLPILAASLTYLHIVL